jgi:general secretion pathway protein F
MGAFEYTALTDEGKNRKGVLEGDTARQIRQQLREKGLTPLQVVEVAQKESVTRSTFSARRGMNAMDLALVTRQIATLISSGLTLEEVLGSVAQQTEKARVKRILLAVRSRVREGHSFSSALSEFPHVFPELYQKTVNAGEQSGHLPVVLERLADYTESRHEMKQKTTLALFYPALLVTLSILIITALLTYVVPKVVQVFENVSQELPLMTRGLIAVSDFTKNYGIFLLIAIFVFILVLRAAFRKEHVRYRWHHFLLGLPIFGKFIKSANAARFARTLSILTASNVQILEALRISAQVLTNLPMRAAVEEANLKVREGSSLKSALEKSGYFPPMTLSLIASGEASGNLEGMLERAAGIQEREMDAITSTLLGLLEPVLILIMGGVILVIVMAILLPVFELNQLVG